MTVLLEYLDFLAKRGKLQLLNFYIANPAPFMLKCNLQPVVTSFITTPRTYDDDDWREYTLLAVYYPPICTKLAKL